MQATRWADLLSQRFFLAATDFCLFASRRAQNTFFFFSLNVTAIVARSGVSNASKTLG